MRFGYAVYFTERANNRVVRWNPDSGEVDVVAGEPLDGDPSQKLSSPYGLAFDPGGSLLIADKLNHRICRLGGGMLHPLRLSDPQGTRSVLPDSPPMYSPSVKCPTGLYMEGGGSFLCTFADDHTIYRILPNGSLQHLLGILPNRSYMFGEIQDTVPPGRVLETPVNVPTGIVKMRDGTLYFIERMHQAVRAYHPSTGLRSLFHSALAFEHRKKAAAPAHPGFDTYHPAFPSSLALDQDGVLHITEAQHACVLRVDPAGGGCDKVLEVDGPMRRFGAGVAALAFGPDGTAWVLNPARGVVEAYAPSGTNPWRALGIELSMVQGQALRLPESGSGLALGH